MAHGDHDGTVFGARGHQKTPHRLLLLRGGDGQLRRRATAVHGRRLRRQAWAGELRPRDGLATRHQLLIQWQYALDVQAVQALSSAQATPQRLAQYDIRQRLQ